MALLLTKILTFCDKWIKKLCEKRIEKFYKNFFWPNYWHNLKKKKKKCFSESLKQIDDLHSSSRHVFFQINKIWLLLEKRLFDRFFKKQSSNSLLSSISLQFIINWIWSRKGVFQSKVQIEKTKLLNSLDFFPSY